MSQLNIYVPNEIEEFIRQKAKSKGKTLSAYLAEIIKAHFKKDKWNKDIFSKVVGGWKGSYPNIKW